MAAVLILAACTTAEVADAIMTTGFDAKGEPLPEVLSYKPDAPEFICLAAVLGASAGDEDHLRLGLQNPGYRDR